MKRHEDNEESAKEVEKEESSHKRHKCIGCDEDCTSEMHHKKHAHKKHHTNAKEKALDKMK